MISKKTVCILILWTIFVEQTSAKFSWIKAVDKVYACTGESAEFPWQYDPSEDVTMIYWRHSGTRETVLAYHTEPKEEVVYYYDKYRDRAVMMDPTKANAGLLIQNINRDDAGGYLIELSGPEDATDLATLFVHPDVTPILSVAGDRILPGENRSVSADEDIPVAIDISGLKYSDISIRADNIEQAFCANAQKCSTKVKLSDFYRYNISVSMIVHSKGCMPKDYTVHLTSEGGVALAASTSSTGVALGVIIPLIIIAVIIIIVFIFCKRKRLRKERYKYDGEVCETDEKLPFEGSVPEVRIAPVGLDEVSTKISTPDLRNAQSEEGINKPVLIKDGPDEPSQSIKMPKHEDLKYPVEESIPTKPSEIPETRESLDIPDDQDLKDTNLPLGSLQELYKRPMSLAELDIMGFAFNEKGQLRTKATDGPFEFNHDPGDRAKNQRRYEDLGEVINEYIFKFMEEKLNLNRINIPLDASPDDPVSFLFASPKAFDADKLLILIHGSGVVRAGQWARSLIINHDLDKGSQIPYIHWGLSQGYGVVVLNTNQTKDPKTGETVQCSQSPEHHAQYIWENFISPSKAKQIVIVAHSYGGIIVTHLAERSQEFRERVSAVAFTDSVHGSRGISQETREFLATKCINWVTSEKPRDTRLSGYEMDDAPRFSAGHREHTWTSYASMESVFNHLREATN